MCVYEGAPSVELKNLKGSVDIDCVPMSDYIYRCIYVPQTPGTSVNLSVMQ